MERTGLCGELVATAFDIRADISKVIEMYGPGLYTLEVLGMVEDSLEVVSSYTLWLR